MANKDITYKQAECDQPIIKQENNRIEVDLHCETTSPRVQKIKQEPKNNFNRTNEETQINNCEPPREIKREIENLRNAYEDCIPKEKIELCQPNRETQPIQERIAGRAPKAASTREINGKLYCNYPVQSRAPKPLITHNGVTDIIFTSDKNKVMYESGVGVQYKLIEDSKEIEAPWCKRNGLQDRWMEDPKYKLKSKDIYSTPYPCCKHGNIANTDEMTKRNINPPAMKQEQDNCKEATGSSMKQDYVDPSFCQNYNYCNTNTPYKDIAPIITNRENINKDNCNFK